MTQARVGIAALVAACTVWGLSPLYYKLIAHVDPLEILAHRTLWSLVFFALVIAWQGRLGQLRAALWSWRKAAVTFFAAAMISVNWFLYILSVQIDRVTEASLGYYIFPLVAVLIGLLAFGERLGRSQWLAVALAGLGVAILAVGLGAAPWISLVLAVSFGLYGLVKKRLSTGPVLSVTAEVLLLSPIALVWLGWLHFGPERPGAAVFGTDAATSALLMLSGVLTAGPLILFSRGAQLVSMATTGLVQYLNPTLQFLCAVVIFGEPFTAVHAAAFALIWLALAIYTASSLGQDSARRRAVIAASGVSAEVTKPRSDRSAKP